MKRPRTEQKQRAGRSLSARGTRSCGWARASHSSAIAGQERHRERATGLGSACTSYLLTVASMTSSPCSFTLIEARDVAFSHMESLELRTHFDMSTFFI